MVESKSGRTFNEINGHSEKCAGFGPRYPNRLGAIQNEMGRPSRNQQRRWIFPDGLAPQRGSTGDEHAQHIGMNNYYRRSTMWYESQWFYARDQPKILGKPSKIADGIRTEPAATWDQKSRE
jgi:hypothetical protein